MLCQGEELRPVLEGSLGATVPTPAQFIGKLDAEGRVVSVAGIAGWTGDDCEIYLASDGRLRRDFIKAVFRYVYRDAGCTRCTCRVDEALTDWVGVLPRLGFVQEGRLRKAQEGRDLLVFGMLKEECRYG